MNKKIILFLLVLFILALSIAICSDINNIPLDRLLENPTPILVPTPLQDEVVPPTPELIISPSPTPILIHDPSPTPSPTPFSNGLIVAIDPGHQSIANYDTEPIGPGSSTVKPKVSTGIRGISTRVSEYQLNLEVSLKLRDELVDRGYSVIMIRETHDVNISNSERAKIATDNRADIFIRVHADGSENRNINGILMFSTSKNNPFIPHLYEENRALSAAILIEMLATTGANNRGIYEVDDMTGSNWATMPVTIIEMGVMTNATEDELMQTEDYQQKLVVGIANGIDQYFLNT